MSDPSTDLQNKWFNGLIQGLGVSQTNFQILQPAPPLVASGNVNTDNNALWNYYNQIPVDDLTLNLVLSGGNSFFQDYSGVMSQMIPPNNINVEADIGTEAFTAWQAYLQRFFPLPAFTQLSSLFLQWASIYYPSVANIGASDYAALALNPISAAQNELLAAYPTGTSPDFFGTYAQLVTQLNSAPSRSFTFNSSNTSNDVSQSWNSGGSSNFFGLFGSSSSSSSSLFEQFSASQVTVDASFEHILIVPATPGNWYNSSAFNIAYSNSASPPWRANAQPNWNNTFSSQGNMQRFMASLIIASGMTIKVHSAAQYSSVQQTTIKTSGSSGFWPFYSGSGSSSSTSTATFNNDDSMDILITSASGIPVVIGGTVISTAQFLGHVAKGTRLFTSASKS